MRIENEEKNIVYNAFYVYRWGRKKSLGLLDSIDYSLYDVDLFLYRHEGEFLKYINYNVNIIPNIKKYNTFDVSIKNYYLADCFYLAFQEFLVK